jgi:ArsR family transcriptional regulator
MKELLRIFKALSDSTRLRIFRLLVRRDLCVCELMYVLEMPQSRVSHQLRLLRDADLVEDRREGKWIIYTVPDQVKKNLEPLLRQFPGPESGSAADAVKDIERLDICRRQNVRGTRGPKGNLRRIPERA